MVVVGLTGGIGSGKTTVAKMFESLGVPIYIADVAAKRLMNSSNNVKNALVKLFGQEAYNNEGLNRAFIASKIFKDDALLAKMNAIVHPEVALDFKQWAAQQTTPYVIKEAAIIFEHHQQANYDVIITVTASVEKKIARVIKRDQSTEGKIKSIMAQQLSDEEKIKLSDFVIVNNELSATENQVLEIHKKLLTNIRNP